MIKIYQKQPIQAEQFDGRQRMVNKYHISVYNENIDEYGGLGDWTPNEYTLNGTFIDVGDWIIKDGEDIHAIPDDMFKKTYAELPVIPKAVADWINECISLGWTRNFLDVCYRAPEPIDKWIDNNSNMFARAWLDGYQVEADNEARR
ncbi:DUF1642 domain-containing protein [Levilactobacillus brevis]|uniref:DUF1642 domain-containing protein n=1 Tax=Levilactobacillus brevis TaxID=1580 RepID=UPI000B353A6C|nr:DUF1642 domain-containing protein [Levilactobacillus brevis]